MTDTQAEVAWQLHVRAARGERLTPEEDTQLKEWYAAQEQAEMAMLKLETTTVDVAALQAQINVMLAQIATATHKIKQLTEENEILRQELIGLRRQLSQHAVLQPA